MSDIKINRGDIFWVGAIQHTGSEQGGNRPAIIISNDIGNKHSGTVEVVFLTSQIKSKQPTHVGIRLELPSTALCESIQTVAKERLGDFIRACSDIEMETIDEALRISLGLSSATKTEANKAEIERDMYAQMYHNLLSMVVGKPVA